MAALDFPASPTLNEVYSANGRSWIWNGTTWNPYGSGIADGDRGDITVSNNGSTWTVDGGAITYAKIQDVSAASKLLGRGDSGSGDVEELTLGTGLSMTGKTLAVTVTDTGITELTGDVTAGPGSGSQAATIPNNTVTFAKMQDISTQHFIGRHTAGSGDPEQVGLDGGLEFQGANIRRSALTGDVTASAGSNTTTIANDAVTYAKMQNVSAASKLLGRGDSGSGDVQEITLGTNLSMSGTTLNATGGGIGGSTGSVDNRLLRADGTGGSTVQSSDITVDDSGNLTTSGSLQADTLILQASTSNELFLLRAPDALSSGTTLYLPDGPGTSGQVLTTDGINTTSWTTVSGGSSPIFSPPLASDWSTTDNTALQNITDLAVAMEANTDYLVTAYLIYTTTATTTGLHIGVTGPAAPTLVNLHGFIYRANNVTPNSGNAQAYGELVFNNNGSAVNASIIVEGVVRNGANAGNLQLQGQVESGVAGTLTIKAGSTLILTPIVEA